MQIDRSIAQALCVRSRCFVNKMNYVYHMSIARKSATQDTHLKIDDENADCFDDFIIENQNARKRMNDAILCSL